MARASGVSTTTVSHVLTGKRPVAAATRERVEAAVRELQYRPNHVARNLRVGTSQMIAVVVPDITNPFYSQLTRGLADALGADYGTWVCNTDGSAKRERRYLSDVLARGRRRPGDRLGRTGPRPRADPDPLQHADGVPGRQHRPPDGRPGDRRGRRGARRPPWRTCWPAAPGGWPRSRARAALGLSRVAGYEAALRGRRACAPRSSCASAATGPGAAGSAAMHRLMRLPSRPDAVFCANDLMAIGALDAARELGLRVPDDVRLVGFDDIEAASLVSPALTTIANPAYETGWSAGNAGARPAAAPARRTSPDGDAALPPDRPRDVVAWTVSADASSQGSRPNR